MIGSSERGSDWLWVLSNQLRFWKLWKAFFFIICHIYDFSIISCCDFSIIHFSSLLRNNDVIITLFFRIQWNSGWVPLEVIWKQFQWSVALRPRHRQKVARKRSDDRSFRKLKSRKILILDYDALILLWLINMTHPPLRLTQALWTSYACTFYEYHLTLNSAYSNYDVIDDDVIYYDVTMT